MTSIQKREGILHKNSNHIWNSDSVFPYSGHTHKCVYNANYGHQPHDTTHMIQIQHLINVYPGIK